MIFFLTILSPLQMAEVDKTDDYNVIAGIQ